MNQIAQKLNAQLQGDDGEIYGSSEIENFDDSYLDRKWADSSIKEPSRGFLAKIKRLLKIA